MNNTPGKLIEKGTLEMRMPVGEAESLTISGQRFTFELAALRNGAPFVKCHETGKSFTLSWEEILDLAHAKGIIVS